MVMWVSKNLGHGFRVGTTFGTKPTQAELARLEKANFIVAVNQRFSTALLSYFMAHGYYVSDIEDLLDHEIEDDVYNEIKSSLDEFKDVMRLINDGGSLTEKRRERLLKATYAIEDILPSKNELKDLNQKLNEIPPVSLSLAFFISFAILIGLLITEMPSVAIYMVWMICTICSFGYIITEKKDRNKQRAEIISQIRKTAKVVISEKSLEI